MYKSLNFPNFVLPLLLTRSPVCRLHRLAFPPNFCVLPNCHLRLLIFIVENHHPPPSISLYSVASFLSLEVGRGVKKVLSFCPVEEEESSWGIGHLPLLFLTFDMQHRRKNQIVPKNCKKLHKQTEKRGDTCIDRMSFNLKM